MFHEWIFGKDILLICYGKSEGIFICIHIWQKGLNILWDQVVFVFLMCMSGVSKNFFKYSFFLFNKVHDVAARVSHKRGHGGESIFKLIFFCCTSLSCQTFFGPESLDRFLGWLLLMMGGSFHVLKKSQNLHFLFNIRQVILSKGQIDCYICMYNKHQCSHKSIKKNCRCAIICTKCDLCVTLRIVYVSYKHIFCSLGCYNDLHMVSKRHYHDIKHSRGGFTFQCGGGDFSRESEQDDPCSVMGSNIQSQSTHDFFKCDSKFHTLQFLIHLVSFNFIVKSRDSSSITLFSEHFLIMFWCKNTHWQFWFREYIIWEAVDEWKNLSPISFSKILINLLFICLNGH